MIAFIGPSELTIAALVGLLLFGGKLPEVMRQVGRVWFGFRRSLNDLKRETGLEDALRDIRSETGGIRDIANDLKEGMDPFAGPEPTKWPPEESQKSADAEDAQDVEVDATKAWSSPTDTVADGDPIDDMNDIDGVTGERLSDVGSATADGADRDCGADADQDPTGDDSAQKKD